MNSPSLQDKPGDWLSFTKKSLSWLLVCLVSMQEFVYNVWEAEEGGSFQGPPSGSTAGTVFMSPSQTGPQAA